MELRPLSEQANADAAALDSGAAQTKTFEAAARNKRNLEAVETLENMARGLSRPNASQGGVLRGAMDGESFSSGVPAVMAAREEATLKDEIRAAAKRLQRKDAQEIAYFIRGWSKAHGLSKDAAAKRIFAALPWNLGASARQRWVQAIYEATGHAWDPDRFKDEEIAAALEHVSKTPTTAGTAAVSRMAERLLQARGIEYRREEGNRLVVAPEGGARFNRFAAAMKKRFLFQIEFMADWQLGSGDAYSNVEALPWSVGIPVDALLNERPFQDPWASLTHEMVHVLSHQDRRAGRLDATHGEIRNTAAFGSKDDPYSAYLALSEFDAYDVQQRVLVNRSHRACESGQDEGFDPRPHDILELARAMCDEILFEFAPAARLADKKLLRLAAQLRRHPGVRLVESRVLSLKLPNAVVTLQAGDIRMMQERPYLDYEFQASGLGSKASLSDIDRALARHIRALSAARGAKARNVRKSLLGLLVYLRQNPDTEIVESQAASAALSGAKLDIASGELKIRFSHPEFAYEFPAPGLSGRSLPEDIAGALERQARGMNAIIAGKALMMRKAAAVIDRLLPLLNKPGARQDPMARRAIEQEFAKLIAIEHSCPATASQRRRRVRKGMRARLDD